MTSQRVSLLLLILFSTTALSQYTVGDRYNKFRKYHVFEKAGFTCTAVIRDRRLPIGSNICKPSNTFILAPLANVTAICTGGGERNGDLTTSNKPFDITRCALVNPGDPTNPTRVPNCVYRDVPVVNRKIVIRLYRRKQEDNFVFNEKNSSQGICPFCFKVGQYSQKMVLNKHCAICDSMSEGVAMAPDQQLDQTRPGTRPDRVSEGILKDLLLSSMQNFRKRPPGEVAAARSSRSSRSLTRSSCSLTRSSPSQSVPESESRAGLAPGPPPGPQLSMRCWDTQTQTANQNTSYTRPATTPHQTSNYTRPDQQLHHTRPATTPDQTSNYTRPDQELEQTGSEVMVSPALLLLLMMMMSLAPPLQAAPSVGDQVKAGAIQAAKTAVNTIIEDPTIMTSFLNLIEGVLGATTSGVAGGVLKAIFGNPEHQQVMDKINDLSKNLKNMHEEMKLVIACESLREVQVSINQAWNQFQLLGKELKVPAATDDDKKKHTDSYFKDYKDKWIQVDLSAFMTHTSYCVENLPKVLIETSHCHNKLMDSIIKEIDVYMMKALYLKIVYYETDKNKVQIDDAIKQYHEAIGALHSERRECFLNRDKLSAHVETDVRAMVPDDKVKQTHLQLAEHIRKGLSEAFISYDWMVVVYKTPHNVMVLTKGHFFNNILKVHVNGLTVAVAWQETKVLFLRLLMLRKLVLLVLMIWYTEENVHWDTML
ncbi:Ribonuclease-like 3 [Merluccius polli]|uniref:Ribonuclease-like 3 n=1 Tax=Merluccius polli TaxID=89951 RepID=A0AA47MDJ7_MERPO|nr:Ribonuclease-like 3 [Merluccius polli]